MSVLSSMFQTDSDHTKFKQWCEKTIVNFTQQDVDEFEKLKDEESRIKMIYNHAKTIPIKSEPAGKYVKIAELKKKEGNQYFAKKDYHNAVTAYNCGIIKCPQTTDTSQELLTLLIANRSAAFYELKEYKYVFNDIDYILELGHYPKKLQYKIWLRKAKCYEALGKEKSSDEAYSQAYECLKYTDLDENAVIEKINQLQSNRSPCSANDAWQLKLAPVSNCDIFVGAATYVCASSAIDFQEDLLHGRFAKAVKDIEPGTIILEEPAFCSVLSFNNSLKNCQHCFLSTKQIVACTNCDKVIFCSTNCERLSNTSYHKYECIFQNILDSTGASVNCLMALRIITQKKLKFFQKKQKLLKEHLKDNCTKAILKKNPYYPDDYDNVFFLCRNESKRKNEELLHFSCMAVFLLNLLKRSDYFNNDKDSIQTLTAEEAYIGALILRHLQLLQFNAHDISELRNVEGSFDDVELSYTSRTIGAGLYPTAALFNHSCDPSVVRYNKGNKLVLRTIKPIKPNDIIYENYGPMYTSTKKEERIQYLFNRYRFECFCTPCIELWPLFENILENEIHVGCRNDKCPYVFIFGREEEEDCLPFLLCPLCKTKTSVFPVLKELMKLQTLLPSADDFYNYNQFEKAVKYYKEGLNILYKNTVPPNSDIPKVQQKIRTCFLHYGNKEDGYLPKKCT